MLNDKIIIKKLKSEKNTTRVNLLTYQTYN